jgi:hypothetical protein
MIKTLANNIQNGVVTFDSATHQQELSGVLTLISTTLEMAMRQIEPIRAEATEG